MKAPHRLQPTFAKASVGAAPASGGRQKIWCLPPLAGEVPAPAEAPWRRWAAGDGGPTRGKFFAERAVHSPPVHLEPEVLKFLQANAEARGVSLEALVNQLLTKETAQIKAAG